MSLVMRLSTETSRPYLGEMTIKKYINQHSSNCKMETQMSSSMTMDYTWKISKMGLAIWRSGYSLCSPWMDGNRQWVLELIPPAASASQDGENYSFIDIKLLNFNKLPSCSLAKVCLTVINNINEVDEVQGIKVFYFSPQMNCPTFTFTSNDPEKLIKIRCQMVYEEEMINVPT